MIAKYGKLALSGLVIILAVMISAYAGSYFFSSTTDFFRNKAVEITSSIWWRIPFYTHVGFGAIALTLGGFQFIEPLRDRFTGWHRTAGKIYVVSVFIASITAFGVAFLAEAGWVAQSGFALLAAAWFLTNYKAYAAIRKGDILRHRAWMIRNYALTFAAVTLRIWLPFEIAALGFSFPDAYRLVAWLSWVPNLIVAELLINRLYGKRPLQASQTSS